MFLCVLYGVHFLLKIKRHLFFQSEAVFGRVQIEMQVRKVEKRIALQLQLRNGWGTYYMKYVTTDLDQN